MRVLIVEDHEDVARLLQVLLESEGIEVAGVVLGSVACDPGCWEGVDAAVIDMHMPEVGGADVIRWLAEHRPDIRRVVATALSEIPLDVRALADDVIQKPFDMDRLMEALR